MLFKPIKVFAEQVKVSVRKFGTQNSAVGYVSLSSKLSNILFCKKVQNKFGYECLSYDKKDLDSYLARYLIFLIVTS